MSDGGNKRVPQPSRERFHATHDTLGRLTLVYFIRHGQAGSRQVYDRLSETGKTQARRLGEWLVRQGIEFDGAISGRLNRQRETVEQVRLAYEESDLRFPEVAASPAWDEFDLDAVYAGIGPQIAGVHPEFRLQFEELERQSKDAGSPVHRKWSACDVTVVRAWIDGAYRYKGESFSEFVARVRSGRGDLADDGRDRKIAVFTSATPAAIWAADALGIKGQEMMQLAAVTYNTGVTVLKIEDGVTRLFQFNGAGHLEDPALLTWR